MLYAPRCQLAKRVDHTIHTEERIRGNIQLYPLIPWG